MVRAWIGMANTPGRDAVVMRAVVDNPGSRLGGGFSIVTTTLKSLASWPPEVVWAVETPVDRSTALLPISVTTPLNRCFGSASMETSAGCPSFTFTISVSSTLTSAVMTEVSAMVIRVLPGEFWMPTTTVSPSRTGKLVREGETVVVGIQNSPGSTLMTIADTSVITAEVKVDETDIVNVKLGQPAEVSIDALPKQRFKGVVTEIGNNAVLRSTGVSTAQTTSGGQEAKDFKVVVTIQDPPP